MTSCPHKACLCFLYRPHFTYFTNFPEASCHELGLRPRKKFFFQSQIHSLHEYIQFIMNGITLWWLTLQRRFEGSLPFLHTLVSCDMRVAGWTPHSAPLLPPVTLCLTHGSMLMRKVSLLLTDYLSANESDLWLLILISHVEDAQSKRADTQGYIYMCMYIL